MLASAVCTIDADVRAIAITMMQNIRNSTLLRFRSIVIVFYIKQLSILMVGNIKKYIRKNKVKVTTYQKLHFNGDETVNIKEYFTELKINYTTRNTVVLPVADLKKIWRKFL